VQAVFALKAFSNTNSLPQAVLLLRKHIAILILYGKLILFGANVFNNKPFRLYLLDQYVIIKTYTASFL
jgi:hypothetical protein